MSLMKFTGSARSLFPKKRSSVSCPSELAIQNPSGPQLPTPGSLLGFSVSSPEKEFCPMTPKNGNGPFMVTPGTALLGEILTWSCSGVKIKHTDLIEALRDAALD